MHPFLNHTPSTVSLLCPTVFEIEEDHYCQAKALSAEKGEAEADQWQHYLSALGLLVLQEWLTEQGCGESITELSQSGYYLQLGAFRVCVLAMEQCLSEQVVIPQALIEDGAAHFYVLLEVAEEQEEVWFRGIIRRDRLLTSISPPLIPDLSPEATSAPQHTVPLSAFEPEPSRLLHYCQYLDPSAIPLPEATSQTIQPMPGIVPTSPKISTAEPVEGPPLSTLRTQLSRWLDHLDSAIDTLQTEGWHVWASYQPVLAYGTRGLADGIRRGKLINLSLDVGIQPVALVLTLMPEAGERIGILVQLLPTGSDRTLVPNIELALLSKKGKVLQHLLSRSQDNYIQLKTFRGTIGQQFSIRVILNNVSITEQFEI